MDLSVLPQFKGGEKELRANMYFDGTNRAFRGTLIPGATIGMHTHEDSCEMIFILSGRGTILELNSAEVALTQARLTYAQSIYDYLTAKADLDKLQGKDYVK